MNTKSDNEVVARVRATLANRGGLITGAILTYRQSDPFAVELYFPISRTTWTIARSLLMDGITDRTGVGDIVVYPCPDDETVLVMELNPPNGYLIIEFVKAEIVSWLERTLALVPDGGEPPIDWESEIATWLDQDGGATV